MTTAGETPAARRLRLKVRRTGIVLKPNNSRVVIRPFEPASDQRIERIIARIMSLSEAKSSPARRGDARVSQPPSKNPPLLLTPL